MTCTSRATAIRPLYQLINGNLCITLIWLDACRQVVTLAVWSAMDPTLALLTNQGARLVEDLRAQAASGIGLTALLASAAPRHRLPSAAATRRSRATAADVVEFLEHCNVHAPKADNLTTEPASPATAHKVRVVCRLSFVLRFTSMLNVECRMSIHE